MRIVDHCTPSPLTDFGQKGSGEAGYLGEPGSDRQRRQRRARLRCGVSIDRLPMTSPAIWRRSSRRALNERLENHETPGRRHPRALHPAVPVRALRRQCRALSRRAAAARRQEPAHAVSRRRSDATGLAQAVGSRRAARLDGRQRHRPSAGRRLARQLRLRAAERRRPRLEPLHQRLHARRAAGRDALHAARHRAAAGRWPRGRSSGRGARARLRRRDDRHAAQGHERQPRRCVARPVLAGGFRAWARRSSCTRCSSAASRGSPTTTW